MHKLRMLAVLTLSFGCSWSCTTRGIRPDGTATTPRPCQAALASGQDDSESGRDIVRAQNESRTAIREKQALERLGYLYVAQARLSNDPGDYKLAEAAAECLALKFPAEPAALLLRGHVLHQLHRFREAEQIARVLVARRTFVLDYGLLGDSLMDQGRLEEAEAAYQKMIDLKPFYQSYVRAAHLRWLKGDLDGAIRLLRLAIDSASPRDPESSAWAWTRLALYELQASRLTEAASAAESALGYRPEYAAALLAKGRILLAMSRASDAVGVLRRAARANPLPEYQWVLADTLRKQKFDGDATLIEADLISRGNTTDPRTLALFLATRRVQPEKAIALTEEELKARTDIFTLDAHAWALAANGRMKEARPMIERALAEGTQDGRLFLHAGVIYAAAGQKQDAQRWLEKAHGLKSTLLPSEAAELSKHLTATH